MALTDIFSSLGGIEKMKITAFETINYENALKAFIVMYNPTTFSTQVKNNWLAEEGADPNGREQQFRGNTSDTVSFEFLFDATGASPPGTDTPGDFNDDYLRAGEKISAIDEINKDGHVDGAIKKFLAIASRMESQTHMPNYLQINWGSYQFRGVLGSATVNYKLFNSAGLPIRATVNASFQESLSRIEQAAQNNVRSPDLTHKHTIKAGETLPIIADRVYGDPALYREIAKVNSLKNFRNIKPGHQLVLPPINK